MTKRRSEKVLAIEEPPLSISVSEDLQNSLRSQNSLIEEDDEEDDAKMAEVPFTKQMRVATRKIHNISDSLVNAKLGLAMSDEMIWAEGLLIFYEIFRFLEAALVKLSPRNDHFNRMHQVIKGVERTEAFEYDLAHFYGTNFRSTYEIRTEVADYLKHLQMLEQREPLRLLAYIYHLYMGLLSGGQVLKKKREFGKRIKAKAFHVLGWFGITGNSSTSGSIKPTGVKNQDRPRPGDAVTTFGQDGRTISDIKKEIAFTMNDIAVDLSKDERNSLISESIEVFKRNNEIVGSIQRTGMVALKNYAILLLLVCASLGAVCYFFWF